MPHLLGSASYPAKKGCLCSATGGSSPEQRLGEIVLCQSFGCDRIDVVCKHKLQHSGDHPCDRHESAFPLALSESQFNTSGKLQSVDHESSGLDTFTQASQPSGNRGPQANGTIRLKGTNPLGR